MCLCWRTKHGTARTTPVAVDPLAAPLRRGKAVPGHGGEDSAGTAAPARSPAPTRWMGPGPHCAAPLGNRWSHPGNCGSEETAGRGPSPRLRYLTPPGVPVSMAELPRATAAEREGVAIRRASRGTPRASSATGPARDNRGR